MALVASEGRSMSPQGRPKGEYRNAQHGGCLMSPQGRPKGEYRNAQHGGCLMSPAGPPPRANTALRSMEVAR